MNTAEVWQHHITSWDKRDLDEIVSEYTDHSILIANNKIYRGTVEIRGVFSFLFQLFDNGNNIIDPETIIERIVYITWHFTPNGDQEYYGTDSFVIEDGKIVYQTIASLLYEKYLMP